MKIYSKLFLGSLLIWSKAIYSSITKKHSNDFQNLKLPCDINKINSEKELNRTIRFFNIRSSLISIGENTLESINEIFIAFRKYLKTKRIIVADKMLFKMYFFVNSFSSSEELLIKLDKDEDCVLRKLIKEYYSDNFNNFKREVLLNKSKTEYFPYFTFYQEIYDGFIKLNLIEKSMLENSVLLYAEMKNISQIYDHFEIFSILVKNKFQGNEIRVKDDQKENLTKFTSCWKTQLLSSSEIFNIVNEFCRYSLSALNEFSIDEYSFIKLKMAPFVILDRLFYIVSLCIGNSDTISRFFRPYETISLHDSIFQKIIESEYFMEISMHYCFWKLNNDSNKEREKIGESIVIKNFLKNYHSDFMNLLQYFENITQLKMLASEIFYFLKKLKGLSIDFEDAAKSETKEAIAESIELLIIFKTDIASIYSVALIFEKYLISQENFINSV